MACHTNVLPVLTNKIFELFVHYQVNYHVDFTNTVNLRSFQKLLQSVTSELSGSDAVLQWSFCCIAISPF